MYMRKKKSSSTFGELINNPAFAKAIFVVVATIFGYHGYEISEKTDKVIDNQAIFLRMDSLEKNRIVQTDARTTMFRSRSDSAYGAMHDHLDLIMQQNESLHSTRDSLIKLNLKTKNQ